MLLKKITLENIRSYREKTEIDIPTGRILFQGDIGCGKSTILSAIEFALFGLGDIDGNALLRSGEKEGSVLLEFEVNNKNYQIFRSLIRRNNKKTTQEEGYIIDGDVITTYSVSEMKSKILKIININEKAQTRTTSVIYRFAIFTPQEMMKQILSEMPEKRLEILRRAFNIEEYSTVKKNTEMLLGWSNAEIRIGSEITKDLQEKETLLYELNNRVSLLATEIEKFNEEISEIHRKVKELKGNIENLKQKEVLVLQLQASIPHLKNTVERNQNSLNQAQDRLIHLKDDLSSITTREILIKQLTPSYEDYLSKKERLKQLESSVKLHDNLEKERTKLEQAIDNARGILESEIDRLTDEKKADTEKIEMEENSIKEALRILEEKESTLKRSIAQLPTLREESANILSLLSKHITEEITIQQQASKKQREIENIISIGENAPCPICRQKLSVEHLSKVKAEFDQEKLGVEEHIRYLKNTIVTYEQQASKTKSLIRNLENEEANLKAIQRELGKLSEKNNAIESGKKTLQLKASLINENLQNLHKENYSLRERKRLAEILRDMAILANDKKLFAELEQTISKYEFEKIELRYIENIQEIKRKTKIEKEIEDVNLLMEALKIELNLDRQKLNDEQTLLDKNKNAISDLKILEADVEKSQNEISELSQMTSGKRSELKLLESNLNQLEREVKDKKDRNQNKQILQHTNNWLEEHFITAVQDIERHVLQNINEEFNQLFQKWFNILMETGDINVEADTNFTPIITQNGYSLGINSLSGGEKTSVALAYRLALNTMLKKIAGMDNALLILDEPTDGFGKEQLVRLTKVLDELQAAQIIMVSHERELEGFVDKIYRVTKDGNRSRINVLGYN
jgi:DNA repair protein SbcC/Rad50